MCQFAGIDVAMRKFDFNIITEEGKSVRHGKFEMSRSGFEEFLGCCSEDTVFVMESTGRYHIPLCNFLVSGGFKALVANPLLVNRFVKSESLRKTKTDKADALSIAKYGLLNYATLSEEKKSVDEGVLAIARRRLNISEDIGKAKTQLQQDLAVAWPEILELDIDTDSMLSFLSVFGSPSEVLAAKTKDLEKPLQKRRGRLLSYTISEIRTKAENSIGDENYGSLVKNSAKKVCRLNEELDELTEAMILGVKKTQPREMEILTSFPGIGEITAAQFLVEIGDITNFENYQKLIGFMGTDPSIYQSGQYNGKGKISKHGNAVLRRTCYLMAQMSVMHNPVFNEYYHKKRAEGFPHRKAMVAVMNKLTKVIFALLTRGEKYEVGNGKTTSKKDD